MTFIPHFSIGLLNGWLFIVPSFLIMMGQPLLYPNGKAVMARMMIHPRNTRLEEIVGRMTQILYFIILILSAFMPIQTGACFCFEHGCIHVGQSPFRDYAHG